jgi:2-oxoglutarate/2-oxoacid ferredoxin oxidoreductase subunit beta
MTTSCTENCAALKPTDFASDQEVKWCPGCGDYSILAQVRKVLARQGIDKCQTVFVSGIGCSSRFPYYVSTYGFHSIHGRACTIATGLKLARPDLSVWIVTGDGDALSIGGNHLLHILRRNLDAKILLFNNRIYGLTKGQYSPTTLKGKKTKSSPMGAPENPMRPISVAIGAEATFVARALANDVKHLEYVLDRAAKHKGTALVEIYQNCVIFDDGGFAYLTDKTVKAERMAYIEHGKPIRFGANNEKAIQLRGMTPTVVNAADVPAESLLIHDEHVSDPSLAFLLSRMTFPDFPEPLGIFRDVDQPCYDGVVREQIAQAIAERGPGNFDKLLRSGSTWRVA